jgi:beta-glucanase (GH16 family)
VLRHFLRVELASPPAPQMHALRLRAALSLALLLAPGAVRAAPRNRELVPPAFPSGASFCAPGAGFSLEFADEFDGPELNESNWRVIEGSSPHPNVDDCYGDQCPMWAGCRAGFCKKENVYMNNGTVVLESNNDGHLNYSFTTATIVSRGLRNWTYSDGTYRMCISAQLPGTEGANNNGLWPAHWLLPDAPALCDPDQGEIDVMEMVNGNGQLYVDYWWQDASWPHNPNLCNNSSAERFVRTIKGVPNWHSAFHEYAFEAGPGHLAVAIDGQVLANWTNQKGATYYNASYYLLINTALGGEWPAPPTNSTKWPANHVVDYVRVARAGW